MPSWAGSTLNSRSSTPSCGARARPSPPNAAKSFPQLSKAASKQLADLGFKQSRLDIALTTLAQSEFTQHATRNTQHGLDTIEFQFAPNPGEPARPLRAIASSGELARVMLALKTVLAAEDQIPVLVFDEVDANVGGETANAVGRKDAANRAEAAGALHYASAASRRACLRALRRHQAGEGGTHRV